jgi:hypothetical protein
MVNMKLRVCASIQDALLTGKEHPWLLRSADGAALRLQRVEIRNGLIVFLAQHEGGTWEEAAWWSTPVLRDDETLRLEFNKNSRLEVLLE